MMFFYAIFCFYYKLINMNKKKFYRLILITIVSLILFGWVLVSLWVRVSLFLCAFFVYTSLIIKQSELVKNDRSTSNQSRLSFQLVSRLIIITYRAAEPTFLWTFIFRLLFNFVFFFFKLISTSN